MKTGKKLLLSLSMAVPLFAFSCDNPSYIRYLYDMESQKVFEYPQLKTNSLDTWKAVHKDFEYWFRHPYAFSYAKKVVEALMFDSDYKKMSIKIEKPKVLYSQLSLYEKSKYSLEQLEKLRKEEERYNFERQKILNIIKNTRTINPLHNGYIEVSLFWMVLFHPENEEVYSFAKKTASGNGLDLRPESKILLDAYEIASGKYPKRYQKRSIVEARKKALERDFSPLRFIDTAILSMVSGEPLPEMKPQWEKQLRWYLHKSLLKRCEENVTMKFNHYSIVASAILSVYFPEYTRKIRKLLSTDYRRGATLFDFVRVFYAKNVNDPSLLEIEDLAPFSISYDKDISDIYSFISKTAVFEVKNRDILASFRLAERLLEIGRGKMDFDAEVALKRGVLDMSKEIQKNLSEKSYYAGSIHVYGVAKNLVSGESK